MSTLAALTLGSLLSLAPMPPPRDLPPPRVPIYATSYNWQFGGRNCDSDCTQFASGLFTRPDLLGRVAACPAAWVGRPQYDGYVVTSWETTVVSFPGTDIEPRYCVDVFGHPRDRDVVWLPESPYREGGVYVLRVDFAEHDPAAFDYNQELLPFWRTATAAIPVEWYEGQFLVREGER